MYVYAANRAGAQQVRGRLHHQEDGGGAVSASNDTEMDADSFRVNPVYRPLRNVAASIPWAAAPISRVRAGGSSAARVRQGSYAQKGD